MHNRITDFGVTIGKLPRGERNAITDVPGVRVGQVTIDTETHKTGVTVVIPAEGCLFRDKVVGATCVINGFGKTLGLMQIDELGSIETPIAITNTLNVGLVHDALVEFAIRDAAAAGMDLRSVNPVVCECNDSGLNDIRHRAVKQKHVFTALENAGKDVEEGCVGAGAGTVCHSLKGGIGTASRVIELDGVKYTLGALVQTNYGHLDDLSIDGKRVGLDIREGIYQEKVDKGSCIVIIGTDLPVSDRQLKRICKRSVVGLARVGSYIGHGSGEVVVGFSNANRIRHEEENDVVTQRVMNENKMDSAFRACGEAVEEAILNSLAAAKTTVGFNGTKKIALSDLWEGNRDA